MQKFLKIIYIFWLFTFFASFSVNAGLTPPPSSFSETPQFFNKDINKVIDQTISASTNPIRDWAKDISDKLKLADENGAKIDNFNTALDTVWWTIKNIIDYLLWFLAFVAIIYLLYYGYILLFNASDDASTKKAYTWVRNAARAIIGIWISWLIVSAAFRVVSRFAK